MEGISMYGRAVSISMACLMVICGLLGIFSMVGEEARAESWVIETVDSKGDVGESTSLALDSNDYPHISYYDVTNTALKYARWTGSAWHIATVDSEGDVGQYTSLALDASDHAHISYYDATNTNLKHARWTGTKWHTETVDSGGEVGAYSSIAVDENLHVHISYYNGTVDLVTRVDALKYARWDGSSWNIETIDYALDVGRFTSIALDDNNYPHISYINCSDNTLKYARWTGSEWDMITITTANRQNEWIRDYGSGTSLALDSNDNAHIVFVDGDYENLRYARWEDGSWIIENVSHARQVYLHVSIALDGSDFPHITYFTRYQNTINYARWNGTGWNIVYVDDIGGNYEGGFNSLALDKSGYTHISYFDYNYDDLKYARLIPSNESLEQVFPTEYRFTFRPFIRLPDPPIVDTTVYEIQRLQHDDVDINWITGFVNDTEVQDIEYVIGEDNDIVADAIFVEIPEQEDDATDDTDYETEQSEVTDPLEIIYIQSKNERDWTENSIRTEQSNSFSNLKRNEASNDVSLFFFLIIVGLNLIILAILTIIVVLIYKRTITK